MVGAKLNRENNTDTHHHRSDIPIKNGTNPTGFKAKPREPTIAAAPTVLQKQIQSIQTRYGNHAQDHREATRGSGVYRWCKSLISYY